MKCFVRSACVALTLFLSVGHWVSGQDGRVALRIIGWNMQSDFTPKQKEANPDLLRQQMAKKKRVHIWGLCEVLNAQDLAKFKQGAEEGTGTAFASVLGTTGGRDRMAILYDATRFELLDHQELGMIQISSGLRASLVAHLREKLTGQELLFMVNHLKRGGAQNEVRLKQAKRLNEWVRTQSLPVIAVGDYNFDWDVVRGDQGVPHRDGGFDALTKDDKFQWVRPEKLVKTQSSPEFNSVLDFVFVANAPFTWFAESRILNRENDEEPQENNFTDDDQQTDHRAVEAVFTIPQELRAFGAPRSPAPLALMGGLGPRPAQTTRDEVLRRITEMEQQLQALRKLVQQLP